MARSAGQKTGQPSAPAGWGWREYLASLVSEHGTLAAVAWKLLERGGGPEDVASIERALRRLRERGTRDGGVWGQRLLRCFGVPRAIEDRLRWMGLYHSPFNDLPIALCEDQLRLWNQSPVAASRARVWLELGAASVALRRRAFDDAKRCLDATAAGAGRSAALDPAAAIELALARAYLASRIGTDEQSFAILDRAETALLQAPSLASADRACFAARLVDHRAFHLNRAGHHAAALALYRTLPLEDLHPFASYRREAGLAHGYLRREDYASARLHAARACEHAGDGGYTRLRAMALILIARVEGPPLAAASLARAHAIALRLGDEELATRVARARAE